MTLFNLHVSYKTQGWEMAASLAIADDVDLQHYPSLVKELKDPGLEQWPEL